MDFIRYYADRALRVIAAPENQVGWTKVGHKGKYNTTIEQYPLAACLRFHRARPGSAVRNVDITYLFESSADAFNPNIATKRGFTYLLAAAKRSVELAERMEKRVQREYPEPYERCLRLIRERESVRSGSAFV